MDKIKVKLVVSIIYELEQKEAGEVIECPENLGRTLIARRQAVEYQETKGKGDTVKLQAPEAVEVVLNEGDKVELNPIEPLEQNNKEKNLKITKRKFK